MSEARRRRSIVVVGADGSRQVEKSVSKAPAKKLVALAPPRSTWLSVGYDPAGHLLVVLAANVPDGSRSPGPQPLLYVNSAAPTHVLLEDGLAGAYCRTDDDGQTVVAPVGTPRDAWAVWCPTCGVEYEVSAADLQAHRGSKPGRSQRFSLRVAHSG